MKTSKLLPVVFALLVVDLALAQAQGIELQRPGVVNKIANARNTEPETRQVLDSYIRLNASEPKFIACAFISETNG